MNTIRLDRYLSEGLGVSRSDAKKLLGSGAVSIDGVPCKKGDTQLCQTAEGGCVQTVCVQGRPVARQQFVYIMMNKPQGVVSAREDARDTTVTDLLDGAFPRRQLFPAGRLDKDSTGFILLTDDGVFAHDLLAPKRHVSKTYLVTIDTPVTEQMAEAFRAGVTLADGSRMQAAVLEPVPGQPMQAKVVLTQGVYHQIKRMFGTLDAGVTGLRRVAIGALPLDESLAPGAWRELTPQELALLQNR